MEHAVFAPAESREVFDFRDNFWLQRCFLISRMPRITIRPELGSLGRFSLQK